MATKKNSKKIITPTTEQAIMRPVGSIKLDQPTTAKTEAPPVETKIEAAPVAKTERNLFVVNQRVSRGPKNLPGYYVAICDDKGTPLSKVYKCIGENIARDLSERMSISHRIPQKPGFIQQAA